MESNKIFCDTNFFVALYNAADTLNPKAIEISKSLTKNNFELYISNYIFLEVVTVLSQRISKKVAIKIGQHLLADGFIKTIHIDEKLNHSSWQIFTALKNKNISFVDCSTLSVMNFLGIKKLLSFDQKDFGPLRKKYGFSFWGG